MNVQTFLQNFGYIANAPDGIKRLREMVLHYAVSGSLVAQIESEGSAEKDVEQANVLRDEFQQQYKIRKRKAAGPLRDEEIPFTIPASWKWARLEKIACYIQRGKGPKYAQSGRALVVSQKCIQWSGFDLTPARRITDDSLEKYGGERFLVENDILWNSTGTGTAGRVALFSSALDLVVADSHVTVIRLTNFIPQYVWCYLASPTIQGRMSPNQEDSMVSGTTNQVELSTSKVSELPVPCPPIAEQKRIVAKVDELMALCDKLESQQQERERRFPVLSRACHARFVQSPTPASLKSIFEGTESASTEDLRKTILALAAIGKLVPQQPTEESAELALQQIKKQRAGLLATGYPNETEARTQIKKQRKQQLPNDLPELPSGWVWSTLMQASLLIVDCHNKTAPYVSDGVRLLRTTNIRNGQMNQIDPKFVTEATYKKWSARCKPEPGDILITREAPMGEVCIIPDGMRVCMGQRMMLIRLCPDAMKREFLLYSLMAPDLMDRVQDKPIGANVKHLRVGGVETLLVPIPPLEEQHRIVLKVDELMALVERLEEQQRKAAKVADAFAQAAVSAITGSAIREQKEKMKAPKTELVSRLQTKSKPRATDQAPLADLLAKHKGELAAKILWQQSGLEIDAFYQQLKTEMAQGWIVEPEKARMTEIEAG